MAPSCKAFIPQRRFDKILIKIFDLVSYGCYKKMQYALIQAEKYRRKWCSTKTNIYSFCDRPMIV